MNAIEKLCPKDPQVNTRALELKKDHLGAIIAVKSENIQVLKELVRLGANLNVHDNERMTPLAHACKLGDSAKVKALLHSTTISVNAPVAGYPNILHYAVMHSTAGVIKILLEDTRVTRNTLSHGKTVLHHAIESRDSSIADILLQAAVPVNQKTSAGFTELHIAVIKKKSPVVSLLVSNPLVDVNAKDNVGNTALHYAVIHREVDIVRELLDGRRVNVNIKNNKGQTPISLAKESKNADIISMLKTRAGKPGCLSCFGAAAF
jgi:ankyrin repeat protein